MKPAVYLDGWKDRFAGAGLKTVNLWLTQVNTLAQINTDMVKNIMPESSGKREAI